MASANPADVAKEIIQQSPDIKLENPPAALFASGSQSHVDLFGQLSVVALRKPTEMVVFDPLEDRRSQGVFDGDDNVDDQIEDIKFIVGRMDTEDPSVLKARIVKIFKFIERHKLFLHGMLEIEANAFGSSLFVDVDPGIINKLEAIHKHYRAEKFPAVEKSGVFKKSTTIRFLGRYGSLGKLWPRQKGITGKDFIVDLNDATGHIAGIVAVHGDVAEFIILVDTITSRDGGIDWIILRQLLEEFKAGKKVPLCWFRWDLGFQALSNIYGFNEIKEDPEIQATIKAYNTRVAHVIMDYYKDATDVFEKQVDILALSRAEKERAEQDLKEAMELLDQWYAETGPDDS